MKKYLLFISLLCCLGADVMAQPATYAMPFSIGRNNCGTVGVQVYRFPSGERIYNNDSVYFFDYVSPNLSRNTLRPAYFPRLRVGASTYNSGNNRDRFTTSAASVSFNPKDGKLYYLWTDYSSNVSATLKTYVWRWNPDTTFSTASFTTPAVGILLDTLCSFTFDIGGITFDNSGNAWQLEFSSTSPYKSRMRKIDFVTKVIDPIPDTLDLIPGAGGIGDTIYNVSSGDITLMPNGQMYYVFDNKLYTPDYGSYGGASHHISSTYIDTIRKPTGATNLVGLSYGNGDLISAFSTGCIYRRIDPVTGDTNYVNYTYAASKGVASSDMSQISSGLGLAKRVVSVTSTGTAGQYNVVYDVVIKNYGTTGLTNLQVYDSLSKINGLLNVSNVSTTMLTVPPPPGIALNPGYNGTTDARLLATTGQNLPNYPVDSSSFTVRINCRISSVLDGVVYYNSAVGFANGYKNVALRDSSTNGSVPDLNQNDKPDDVDEGVPTPFVIAVDPINSPCGTLSSVLYSENFGSGVIAGSGLLATMPTSPNTTGSTYTGTTVAPIAKNNFAIVTNPNNANTTDFISMADHTGGANGRMLLVNADAPTRIIFRDTLPTACAGRQYSFSFWAAFPYSASYLASCTALGGFRYPKFKVQFRDLVSGLVSVADTTTNITSNGWTQYGYRWTMPPGATNLILELVNAAPGGCGNDFVIDDIVYGTCDPLPVATASNSPVCLGDSVRFVSSLTDPSAIPGTKDYQWQVASAPGGPWANILGATSSTYLIYPALASDTGKYYRVIVAPQGSIAVAMCQAISSGVLLSGRKPSTAPASITASAPTICNGSAVTLTANGGVLGTGANYQWGTGSVVGTSPIGGATSSTLNVSPTSTTTYWVRIENTSSPCQAVTGGVTVTVTVNQPSTAPTSITGPNVCNGSSTTLTAAGGVLGSGANYQWGIGSTPGANPIGGATSSTLTVSPTTTTTYWVKIKNTSAPCADSTAGVTRIVTVNPVPDVVQPSSQALCPGSSTSAVAFSGAVPGTAYSWSNSNTAIGLGASGSGNIPSFTATNAGTTPITGTITVTPSYTNAGVTCTGTPKNFTITVNPTPTVNAPSNQALCPGSSTSAVAFSGAVAGTTYSWSNSNTAIGLGASGSGNIPSFTVTNAGTTAITATITVTPSYTNAGATCTGTPQVFTITVKPTPDVTQPADVPLCKGSVSSAISFSSAVAGTTYTWTNSNTAIGLAASGSGNVPSFTATNAGSTPISGTITVTPTAAGCPGPSKIFTITVNLASTAPTSATGPDICNGASTTLTASGGVLGTGANYQWGTGAVVGTNPIVGATSSTLTVSPTVTTTYWVRIENGIAPCAVNTAGVTKTITVSQLSVAATSAGKNKNNICPGISAKIFRTGGSLGTTASWKWYTGSPGGTLIGSGDTLTVTPLVTTTYYVRAEGFCNTTTAQSVTIFISCDIDKDKDGIPDYMENNFAAAAANGYNTGYAGYVDYNNDFINDNFEADGDSDNDGTPNYLDIDFPGRVDSNSDGIDDRFDTDLDGVINMLDLDSDNDGIPDVVEAYGVDADGNGKIDNFTDTDGDGLSQNVDANNTGANNSSVGLGSIDLDGDGIPNFLDLDSDNDGIPDIVEAGAPDTNNNGKVDGFTDVNGDGLHDSYINAGALIITGTDGNNDGRADSWPNKNMDRDLRPNAYDMDSDGDGIVDVIEAGLPDANFDGKVDGTIAANGWSTSVSALVSLNLRSTDADGKPDYLDIDADDDGIPDNIEGQTTAGYKLPLLTDADGDGLALPYDNLPAAFGGSGILVYDHDGDGIPDYRDSDSDADGLSDRVEGNDFNLNGAPDDNVTLTGLDTDGDGLDNRFDSLTSVTNIKGTSYRMGASGSFTGDPTPGSRCTVQRTWSYQTDRDWRFSGYVLPVKFLNLTGVLQSQKVLLNWKVIADKEVDHFEVERSINNSTYYKTGTVTKNIRLNTAEDLAFTDDISNVNSDVIYYRIKVVGKAGEIQYSNILVIRKQVNKTGLTIMPNPAKDNVFISFFAEKESIVTIRLIDDNGKMVLLKDQKVAKGSNTIQLTGLDRYSSGMYVIQVYVNNEVVSQKLVLIK